MEQTLAAVFGVIITGILSGAAASASGINVVPGASGLVLAMEAEEEQEQAVGRGGRREATPAPAFWRERLRTPSLLRQRGRL